MIKIPKNSYITVSGRKTSRKENIKKEEKPFLATSMICT